MHLMKFMEHEFIMRNSNVRVREFKVTPAAYLKIFWAQL